MKKLTTIIICCCLGYLLYPVVHPMLKIIHNPPAENRDRFYLDCVVDHHFEAFGGVILKLSNPKEGKEAFWAYGSELGLPPAGHVVPLVIDRLQIPLLNGYFFLYRVSNDTKKENIQRLNELYD